MRSTLFILTVVLSLVACAKGKDVTQQKNVIQQNDTSENDTSEKDVSEGKDRMHGIWISYEGEMLIIESTRSEFQKEMFEDSDYRVERKNNEIIISSSSSMDNDIQASKAEVFSFEVKNISDHELILKSKDESTKTAFSGRETVKFIKKGHLKTDDFSFEKVVFHSSACLGTCPIIEMTIFSDKSVEMTAIYFSAPGKKDEKKSGKYKGVLSQEDFDEVITELLQSRVGLYDYVPRVNCCDAPVKSVTTYHNGTSNKVYGMFPPSFFKPIISILSKLANPDSLEKI
ncbi:MAG: DUF6438 domain-containing protein [Brumimicrobium sp.]